MRATRYLVLILALLVIGCSPGKRVCDIPSDDRSVLEQAESMELFSLHPKDNPTLLDENATKGGFRGWKILGQTQVDEERIRRNVASEVIEGCLRSDGVMMKCFEPRHGIRVTRDGRTVDLVICFVCRFGYVYQGDHLTKIFHTDTYAHDTLNRILQNAGVPLAE